MKVFCRFAPANRPATTSGVYGSDAQLVLRAEGQPPASSSKPTAGAASSTATRVHLADPVTLSKAAFSCDGVFLPPPAAGAMPALLQQQQQQQQQELLYAQTCRCFLGGASSASVAPAEVAGDVPRRVYLAYGQTASGKTYSLFGPPPTPRGPAADLLPAAGVVPRFLYDVLGGGTPNSSGIESAFVDLSCFEVYNEVTTDLVALSTVLVSSQAMRTASGANASPSHRRSAANTSAFELQQEQAPVWAAHLLYRDAQGDAEDAGFVKSSSPGAAQLNSVSSQASQEDDGAARRFFVKTEYRATERQQVLRSLGRARCTTFAAAQAVLQALLTLRQECATSRNQSSSRGHLVFRVEVYATSRSQGGWTLQHETAFVDLAGSESGRLADADVMPNEPFVAVDAGQHRYCRGRYSGPASVNGSLLSTSRASSQHSRHSHDSSARSTGSSQHSDGSHASSTSAAAYHHYLLHPPREEDGRAQRARRQRETRCINASLLALRKVFRALYEATQFISSGTGRVGPLSRHSAASAALRRPPLHHAPFKDSALTAVLQPFLTPQSAPSSTAPSISASPPHVVLLVCCSSRSADFYETVASLRLGAEATAVNPEVVLRALPVQQREQQQQQRSHLRGFSRGQCLSGSGDRRSSRLLTSAPQKLTRSASAPTQRLLLSCAGDGDVDKVESSNRLRRTESCGDHLPVNRETRNAGAADEVARLRNEVQRYKSTAQQLYKQCKSLCESYDECVEELGKCHAALMERDARVAELERRLAAATAPHQNTKQQPSSSAVLLAPPPPLTAIDGAAKHATGEAGRTTSTAVAAAGSSASTPPAKNLTQMAEGPPSSAARSRGSSSPAARIQQQQQLFEMQRISRHPSTDTAAAAAAAAAAGEGGGVGGRGAADQRVSEGQARVARASRPRGVSSSTAREESVRCMVSVSPFSTASLTAAGTSGDAAAEDEAMAAEYDVASALEDEDTVIDSDASPFFVSRASAEGHTCSTGGALTAFNGQPQPQPQLQKARSIMNTLLARQIFPPAPTRAAVPALPTTTTSLERESSPSPVLPTLSAHNPAAITTTSTLASTTGAPAPPSSNVRATAQLPLTLLPTNTTSPPCPSCGAARSSASTHAGSGGATASSFTTSEKEAAWHSSSSGGRRMSEEETDEVHHQHQQQQRWLQRSDGLPSRTTITATTAEVDRESPLSAFPQQVVAPSTNDRTSPSESGQSIVMSTEREDDTQAKGGDEVQEIVIAYRGSPAAGRVAATSESSTRRSKSTVYTALMPPSPSRSPASSRSPSFHESLPATYDVYQL